MKNKLLIIAAVIVLAVGGFLIFNSKSDNGSSQKTDTKTSEEQKTSSEPNSAKTASIIKSDCTLYTKDNIQNIWGVNITDTENTKPFSIGGSYTDAIENNCHYSETNTGKGLSVSIKIRNFATESDAKQDLDNVRNGTKIGTKTYFSLLPIADVGDEAFFSINETSDLVKKTEDYLYLRKGNRVFHFTAVNLAGLDHTTSRDKVISTAKLKIN